jgi:hypothetical protein
MVTTLVIKEENDKWSDNMISGSGPGISDNIRILEQWQILKN